MDDMHQIKELLREIRDLQKAHFERYKEFTQSVLDRQEASAETLQRSRSEQSRYREEMRRAVHESQQRVRSLQTSRWVMLAVAIALAVLAIGGVMFTIVYRMGHW